MAENSAIEWTDHTFNPWMGCTALSPACDHCYAEAIMDHRYGRVQWGPHGERVRTAPANWAKPRAWQRQAAAFLAEHGRRQRVFCASLADVFDNKAPAGARDDLWQLIRETPDLDWLLLTKRPQNIARMLPPFWDEIRGHVWLGTSTENQEEAERRLLPLLEISPRPAVFFASVEPLLEPIDFTFIRQPNMGGGPWWFDALDENRGGWFEDEAATVPSDDGIDHKGYVGRLDWVIVGGESGPKARTTHPDWIRQIRDQCAAVGTAFFFKQWGEHEADQIGKEDARSISHPPGHVIFRRVGKKAAGRRLDGRLHDDFPGGAKDG